MPARLHFDYHASDIISDILGRGHSSRLYNRLVKEREVFTLYLPTLPDLLILVCLFLVVVPQKVSI